MLLDADLENESVVMKTQNKPIQEIRSAIRTWEFTIEGFDFAFM